MTGGRRSLAAVAAVMLTCAAASSDAQPPGPRVFKVGILTHAMTPWHPETEGFRDGLKALGYVEHQNLTFEARAAEGDVSRVARMAAELTRAKPDVLLCVATPSAHACQQATKNIPIVMVAVSDPVDLGLVQSLARPGANITGIATLGADLAAKRLELFKAAVPTLMRVLVSYDPREPEDMIAVAALRPAARELGVTLLEQPIAAPLDIEPALGRLREGGTDGILIVQSGATLNIPARSLEVATSNHIPTMYPRSFWTRFGALLAYGPDQRLQGQQAARLADRILRGTPPRALPVELSDRVEFTVNLKTARRLKLRIPDAVVVRADRVVE